jgi:hypothetical protein
MGDVRFQSSGQGNRSRPRPCANRYIPTARLRERVVIRFEMNGTGPRPGVHPQNPLIVVPNEGAVGFLSIRDINCAFRCSNRGRGSGARGARGRRMEHAYQSEAGDRNQDQLKPASHFHRGLSPSAGGLGRLDPDPHVKHFPQLARPAAPPPCSNCPRRRPQSPASNLAPVRNRSSQC